MEINCHYCNQLFEIRAYRIAKTEHPCCSYSCAGHLRVAKGLCLGSKFPKETIERMEHFYTKTSKTLPEIAAELRANRSTIMNYARTRKWVRFKRSDSVRKLYRKAAEEKIRRKLKKGEHVHHIDGDVTNNDYDNICTFPDAKSHTQAHGSLEKLGFILVKKGIIKFSKKGKHYYFDPKFVI